MADRIEEISSALQSFEEERLATLRQAGKNDPVAGAPLRHQISREPDDVVMIEPGMWIDDGWASARTGLPPSCPVIPLGRDGQVCFFLDTMGSVFELDARSSGKGPIGALFGGRSRYLEWAWPRWSQPKQVKRKVEGGEIETISLPSKIIGWQADDARQCLVDACSYMGIYDATDQVRGRGAWKADDGSLIYHAGDRVLVRGRWEQPGEYDGRIYPARPRIGRPTMRAQPGGPGSAGDELIDALRTFNWDRPEVDPRLVLGWVMTAKVGGALARRPVLFVHGGEGSGKSTLQELLRLVMNGALIATAEATQAGIYHHLKQDSIAVMVDELEAKDDGRSVDKIMALARIAYSGDKMHRGSKEGAGKEFTLMSSFMASAVNKPATEAQDDSRMAVVMLREREKAGGSLGVSVGTADAWGRHLLRRWFDWWPRWAELLAVMRGALIEAGHNDRGCDTFAPLASACHVALRDDMPEPGELEDWMRWLNPKELEEITSRERTWRRCLTHLLSANVEAWRQNTDKTIAAVLMELRRNPGWARTSVERLNQIGMSLIWPKGMEESYATARLFVPANQPAVHDLYDGTPWAGRLGAPGPWCNALRQAPRELWENAKCGRGLIAKTSGLAIDVARALGETEFD
jgi:hypothetical protein